MLIPALASKPVSTIATKLLGNSVPIFMLHRIHPDNTPGATHTPAFIRKCLTYLRKHDFHFVSVKDVLLAKINNTSLPKKSVAFTIDDGFYDQGNLAAPVFIEFHCPVTIFLISNFIDGVEWPWFSKVEYMIKNTTCSHIEFDNTKKKVSYSLTSLIEKHIATREILESIKRINWSNLDDILTHLESITRIKIPEIPPEHYKPMSWTRIRELENSGISFGPHTLSHPILSRVSDKQSESEIHQSWQKLKGQLQNPAPIFCYPNGGRLDYGEREINLLKQTDMLGAISTIPTQFLANSTAPDYVYNIPRYGLPESFNNFIMYSSWIEHAKELMRQKTH